MDKDDKRKFSRIDALNLLAYICYDDSGQIVMQGMGRTLNVSAGGILLQTHTLIDSKNTISLKIGFKNDLIDIKGKAVHSYPAEDNTFEAGIEFFDIDGQAEKILLQYVKAFKNAT